MKCLDDCHNYALDTFMNGPSVLISFYRMATDGTKIDGVTNEEVIKVLIHRITYLNDVWQDGKFNCDENGRAIEHLKLALDHLEQRTYDRSRRGVEGTHSK